MLLIALLVAMWVLSWIPAALIAVGLVLLAFKGRRRLIGVALLVVGVPWLALGPCRLELRPPATVHRTPSPDGKGEVWLQRFWMNNDVVKWRAPRDKGSLRWGASTQVRLIIGPGDPLPAVRGFVWLPQGDRFYVEWSGYPTPAVGPVVEVASGRSRQPTEEEVRWLLGSGQLGERDSRWLRGLARDYYGYSIPATNGSTTPPGPARTWPRRPS